MDVALDPVSANGKITVLLVDDHALVRRGFRCMLSDEDRIAVVGEASSGQEAVRMASELKPKVVLMDCIMPGMDGVIATQEILKTSPEIRVLMVSMHAEEFWQRRAASAGARGFVIKNANDLDLGAAITKVAAGELLFERASAQSAPAHHEKRELSGRELQVLQLIVEGKSNKEIAVALDLSINTVGSHRARIMTATGVRKTADLVMYAIRKNLVTVRE